MSSFLRESIVIKSTTEVAIEVHINLFLPQKTTKTLSFEMGVLVRDVKHGERSPTIYIIFPFSKQKEISKKIEIIDLQTLFQDQKNFRRLIFNEELKNFGKNFKLKGETICFHKIFQFANSAIKLKNAIKGSYYRFRIEGIETNSLIVEKQSSSFIGDPIKRSIKIIGFHINNERNLKGDKPNTSKNRVSFLCVNTFVVCNMGVDILDSIEKKRSFRVLENQTVWEKYLNGCLNEDEIAKTVVYQFKKEENIREPNDSNSRQKEFKDFKLFIKFLETESNRWNILPTISAIITLAFITNTLYGSICNLYSPYMTIICLITLILTTLFLFWRSEK